MYPQRSSRYLSRPSARLQRGFALPRQLFPELPGSRPNVQRVASPSFGSFFADFAAHSLLHEGPWWESRVSRVCHSVPLTLRNANDLHTVQEN